MCEYITRLSRKNRTDIVYKNYGGVTDLFDNEVKSFYRINDEEYDFICKNSNDEELGAFVLGSNPTITEIRRSLLVCNKYVALYRKQE